ncbi:MAG: DUF2807 domain-containing protein [Bacteroidales bacterium]
MKNYLIKAAIGLVIILAVMACEKNTTVIPSDNITIEYRDIAGYTELDVNDVFEVQVNFSDTPEPVEIIANENLHQYIEVEKSSDKLLIRLQDNVSISGKAQLKVVLTTGYLTGYTANGASLIQLEDTLQASQVAIYLTGASNMSGAMIIQSLSADLRDASLLYITGETTDFSLTASGASNMNGYSFSCLNLDADLSDASLAELTVNGKINIKASGASILRYKGNGTLESQDLKDASKVIKID